MKMTNWLGAIILLAVCLLQPAVGSAVTLGQIDNFQDGTTQNWVVGNVFGNLVPPVIVNEPPDLVGAVNHYLLLTADGGAGTNTPDPGSRLAVINQTQWAGNYLAAGGVNTITMLVNNLGPTTLALRLYVADGTTRAPVNTAVSKKPVFLPAGSGWTSASFPLAPTTLTAIRGSVQLALTNAKEIRLFHNPAALFPGPPVVAQLGVDNIKAARQNSRFPLPLPFLPLLLLDD